MTTPVVTCYVGGPDHLKDLRKAGLKPIVNRRKNVSYLLEEVDQAIDQFKRMGWPTKD